MSFNRIAWISNFLIIAVVSVPLKNLMKKWGTTTTNYKLCMMDSSSDEKTVLYLGIEKEISLRSLKKTKTKKHAEEKKRPNDLCKNYRRLQMDFLYLLQRKYYLRWKLVHSESRIMQILLDILMHNQRYSIICSSF